MYRSVHALVVLAIVGAFTLLQLSTARTQGSVIVIEGKTYALSGQRIRPVGEVTINATILDGSGRKLLIKSAKDGTFSFPIEKINENTAVTFRFSKPTEGLNPAVVSSVLGEPKSTIHVVLLQDLPAVRTVKGELEELVKEYNKGVQ